MPENNLSFKNIWSVAYPPLCYIALQFITSIGVSALFSYLEIFNIGRNMNSADVAGISLIVSTVFSLGVFVPLFLMVNGVPVRSIFSEKVRFADFVTISLFSLGLNLIIIVIVVYYSPYVQSYKSVSAFFTSLNIIIRIISTCFLIPIVEEICFRGIVFNRLQRFTPFWLAIFLQSVIFALFHFNALQSFYTFFAGFFFAFLYWKYGNIWASILSHIMFNLSNLIFSRIFGSLSIEINDFFWNVILITGFLLVTLTFLIILKHDNSTRLKEMPDAGND